MSKGVASGPIYFFQRPDTEIVKTSAADIEAEKTRIAAAQEKSVTQLRLWRKRQGPGADLGLLETFLVIGIDELSVTPTAVLLLRAGIRKSIAKTCTLKLLEC